MTELTKKLRKAENIDEVKKILMEGGVNLKDEKVKEIYDGIKKAISDEDLEKIAGGMASRYDIML